MMVTRFLKRFAAASGGRTITMPALTPPVRSYHSQYLVKVGIQEFLNGVGKGVETHVPKLEAEIGDFQKLLVARTLRLKKLGIPCKHDSITWKVQEKLAGSNIDSNDVKCYMSNDLQPPYSNRVVSWKVKRKLILSYAHKYRLGLWRPRDPKTITHK